MNFDSTNEELPNANDLQNPAGAEYDRGIENLRFTGEERRGVYRAIYERRDIRSYRPERLNGALILRILDAAHHAPSVGFMQPWNFILIENKATRKRLYDHFLQVNSKAASHYDGDRLRHYQSLKLQGLLDAPHLLLVTCDTTRNGKHVLGRATIPETDIYSTCLAIENLWLAARAEGVGVGWMSLYEPEQISKEFSLPPGVIPVALLAMGYAVESPSEPLLQSTGWRERLPLEDVVFYEQWGGKECPPSLESMNRHFTENRGESDTESGEYDAAGRITQSSQADTYDIPDDSESASVADAASQAILRNRNLTKPPESLGRLEEIMVQLARIQNRVHPSFRNKHMLLFAGDHGIASEGVSAYRKELTTKMVYQYIAGGGAINVFCRQNGIHLSVVDVGVDHEFSGALGLIDRKVRRSTRNFLEERAMTREELESALEAGRFVVRSLKNPHIIGMGEMGIGNSTSAVAITVAALGLKPEIVCGRGTGVGEKTYSRKIDLIRKASEKHGLTAHSYGPLEILQIFGGYEIAAITGAILEARVRKIPVVLDGFITATAAFLACKIEPECRGILFAGHLSKEPGHAFLLEAMELEPILDLSMGLGEGSGAALAMGLIESAARIQSEMRTFEEAGIEEPLDERGRE